MAVAAGEDKASNAGTGVSTRALVACVVIAVHVAVLISLGRGVRRSTQLVEVFLTLVPIVTEEKPSQPLRSPTVPPPKAREAAKPRVASTTPASSEPREQPTSAEAPAPVAASSSGAPAAPIDWYAEAQATASAVEQRDRANRERLPLDRPAGTALAPDRHGKPPCPFEQCEPGWGAPPSVFDSTASKKGRVEKAADGEVIRWTSNRCYQILVTPNILHRGMTRCVQPLGKKHARGDLFKHMHDPPPPQDRATDVP